MAVDRRPSMKQDSHSEHNMPSSEHDGVTLKSFPDKPKTVSPEWIDRRMDEMDYDYRRPVTTGKDFIP